MVMSRTPDRANTQLAKKAYIIEQLNNLDRILSSELSADDISHEIRRLTSERSIRSKRTSNALAPLANSDSNNVQKLKLIFQTQAESVGSSQGLGEHLKEDYLLFSAYQAESPVECVKKYLELKRLTLNEHVSVDFLQPLHVEGLKVIVQNLGDILQHGFILIDAQTIDKLFVETYKYIACETIFLVLFRYLEVFLYQFRIKFENQKISKTGLLEILDALRTYILPVSQYCSKLLKTVPESLYTMFYKRTTDIFDINLKTISDSWSSCLTLELGGIFTENHDNTTIEGAKVVSTFGQVLNDTNLSAMFHILWREIKDKFINLLTTVIPNFNRNMENASVATLYVHISTMSSLKENVVASSIVDLNQVIDSSIDLLKKLTLKKMLQHFDVYILPDISKNKWDSFRPFLENTRCTHGILMWNLYLKAIFQDLSIQTVTKDDSLERAIFEEFLCQSFLQIVESYLSISPSRGRLLQYKVDVYFILEIIESWTSVLTQTQQIRLYSLTTYFLSGTTFIICPIEIVLEYLSAFIQQKKWDYNPSLEINRVNVAIPASSNPLIQYNTCLDGKALDHDSILKKEIVWRRNFAYEPTVDQVKSFIKLRHEFHTDDYPPLEENHLKLYGELQLLLEKLG